MKTEILKITDRAPVDESKLKKAAEILRTGGLVAFPTETVYGLAANALDGEAVKSIFEAKGRPADNPLIVHVCPGFDLSRIVRKIPESAQKLMDAFWPGPMTLIMPKNKAISDHVTGGLDTVAVRMPVDKSAMALLTRTGLPIVAPSANTSGRPSPTTADHVYEDLKGKIPLILDGGACQYGLESTIVDLTVDPPMVLRPGAITMEMLRKVLPDIVEDPTAAAGKSIPANVKPKAPGMKYRHYAPKAPLTLIEGAGAHMDAAFRRQARILQQQGETVGILASHETCAALADLIPENLRKDYGPRGDLPAIAARIYEALISLNDTPATALLAEGTTERGLGLAIMNRLHKASGFHSLHCRK